MKLIDKDIIIGEIDRRIVAFREVLKTCDLDFTQTVIKSLISSYESLKQFIDTIEVREISEHNDFDLDKIIEDMGVNPNSRFGDMLKKSYWKAIDECLMKKGEQLRIEAKQTN